MLNINPRNDGLMKEYVYGDKKLATVNDVVGMDVKDAIDNLKPFKVEFSGNGKKVIYQSHKAGTILDEGTTIKLLLEE